MSAPLPADQISTGAGQGADAATAATEPVRRPGSLPSGDSMSKDHKQLCKFYDVDTIEALVDAQSKHVERLQAQLPPSPDPFRPKRVREG